jgi:hypothetical protein
MRRVITLAERLRQAPRVVRSARQNDRTLDEESMQIATALADIEESAVDLFDNLVPRLFLLEPTSELADDVLNDVGDAYRHILYHILDTKLFVYIMPDA